MKKQMAGGVCGVLARAGCLAFLLAACTPAPKGEPPHAAKLWEGELRILPGDTSFTPCGTLRKLQVTGPGLDSLARRYAWLHTMPGQWIKTWCNGWLAAPRGAGADSVLVAESYAHMDADVRCAPVPVDSLAGRYVAEMPFPGGVHTEELDFLPGGRALIISILPAVYAEVDGLWGLDSDGRPAFEEAERRYSFRYVRVPGGLVRRLPSGNQVEYKYTGPAERFTGAYARTARWLAAVAAANHHPVNAAEILPAMRLDSLFPDPASRAALRASAGDTLLMDERKLASSWAAATTVQDAVQLMRTRLRDARSR